MKKKLFENVGGNQFKLVKEASLSEIHPPTPVPVSELPITVTDIVNFYLRPHPSIDYEGEPWHNQMDDLFRKTAKIIKAEKYEGQTFHNGKHVRGGETDYIYEVTVQYDELDGRKSRIIFGVSSDGKHIQDFG